MNDKEAKEKVNKTFEQILKSESIIQLSNIINKDELLTNNKMDEKKYPNLGYTISNDDIKELKKEGKLDNKGFFSENISELKLTSLEKILYSIIWKNGDIRKEYHIVDGIDSIGNNQYEDNRSNGLVFYQFGRHLAEPKEPIIDQHVLRAFAIFRCESDEIQKIREKGTTKKSDIGMINVYKNWLI